MRPTGNLFTLPAPIRDAGLLLARALLGAVLIRPRMAEAAHERH